MSHSRPPAEHCDVDRRGAGQKDVSSDREDAPCTPSEPEQRKARDGPELIERLPKSPLRRAAPAPGFGLPFHLGTESR